MLGCRCVCEWQRGRWKGVTLLMMSCRFHAPSVFLCLLSKLNLSFSFPLCSAVFSPPLSYLPIWVCVSIPDPAFLSLLPSFSCFLSVTSKIFHVSLWLKRDIRTDGILYWYSNNSPRGDDRRPLSLILDVKTLIPIFCTFCMHEINPRLAGKI